MLLAGMAMTVCAKGALGKSVSFSMSSSNATGGNVMYIFESQQSLPKRPARILMIVENLSVPFDRRVWNEATTLRAAGYQVVVICPTGPNETALYECIGGIHVYRHPLPMEGSGAIGFAVEYAAALTCEWALACWVLVRHGFDAIHICNPPDLLFLVGGFFKVLFGKKLVFDHHDLGPELYEAKFGRRDFLYRLLVRLERWTYYCADVSLATNESYRKVAVERCGMDPERVFVVRSGPDLKRLKVVPADDTLRCGRKYLVAYLGVIGQQDGLDLLLQSVAHTVHTVGRTDVHFGIVGGGPALDATRKLAADLKVEDFVTFTGRAPDDLLLRMLNTADVCVNPDRVNEANDKSTMNKTLEYMALGKPIVQFEMTEGRNSARDASLYAKPNDPEDFAACVLDLLADPERRRAMGAYGRRRIEEQLSWAHEAPKLLAAYDALFPSVVPVAIGAGKRRS